MNYNVNIPYVWYAGYDVTPGGLEPTGGESLSWGGSSVEKH